MAKVIDRGLAGPDDPIYKGGLRVSSVLGPSALTKNSQPSTAGENPTSAPSDPEPEMKPAREALERQAMELASRAQSSHPGAAVTDPMLPAMNGLEAAMLEQAAAFMATGKPPQAPSESSDPD